MEKKRKKKIAVPGESQNSLLKFVKCVENYI